MTANSEGTESLMAEEHVFTVEIKSKWIAALKSGEYMQGRGMLYNEDNDTYCCLGVLCRVVGLDLVHGFYADGGEVISTSGKYLYLSKGAQNYLAALNDHGVPFSRIADYIESNIDAE